MEIVGMITLRVSDDKYSRIRLQINNNDKKGVQLQVISYFGVSKWHVVYFAIKGISGCKMLENPWSRVSAQLFL